MVLENSMQIIRLKNLLIFYRHTHLHNYQLSFFAFFKGKKIEWSEKLFRFQLITNIFKSKYFIYYIGFKHLLLYLNMNTCESIAKDRVKMGSPDFTFWIANTPRLGLHDLEWLKIQGGWVNYITLAPSLINSCLFLFNTYFSYIPNTKTIIFK